MYDIIQHVTGTSNAIARGSDGDRFEKFTRYNRLSTTITALAFNPYVDLTRFANFPSCC